MSGFCSPQKRVRFWIGSLLIALLVAAGCPSKDPNRVQGYVD